MISYTCARLGQDELVALYTIDQPFASAVLDAIMVLLAEEDIPEDWRGEQCWLDLRIRRWKAIGDLHTRLADFTEGTAQELQISEEEEILISEIMVCVNTLVQKAGEKKLSTLETAATVVGVVGGLIAISAAVGLS